MFELIPEDIMRIKNQALVQKFENIRSQMHGEVNKEYYDSKSQADGQIDYDQYQEMLQQINYDIAW